MHKANDGADIALNENKYGDVNRDNNDHSQNRKLFVVGIGYSNLNDHAHNVVLNAEIIYSSKRLAEVFEKYDEFDAVKEKIVILNSVHETITAIKEKLMPTPLPVGQTLNVEPAAEFTSEASLASTHIVLLASGDPLFYGIGRMVMDEFGHSDLETGIALTNMVEIIPEMSSVQVAFSRIKIPWDDALMISVHGSSKQQLLHDKDDKDIAEVKDKKNPLRYRPENLPELLVDHSKIAILTDPVNNPVKIAKVLIDSLGALQQNSIIMYICERLGYDDERITKGTPEEIAVENEFSDPNVTIIIRTSRGKLSISNTPVVGTSAESPTYILPTNNKANPVVRFGLTENDINHERGLITKDEVRAVSIHKLQLPQIGVLWDVGAGSGSVSIEAARLFPQLQVIAIEKEQSRSSMIAENIDKFDVQNIRIVQGEAPAALDCELSPSRVFVGGSAGNLKSIIEHVSAIMSSGIIVVNAVTLDTLHESIEELERHGFAVDVTEIAISKMKMVGGKRHLSGQNPVFLIKGQRAKDSVIASV